VLGRRISAVGSASREGESHNFLLNRRFSSPKGARRDEETHQIVKEVMETAPTGLSVPLRIDIKTGGTWAGCK